MHVYMYMYVRKVNSSNEVGMWVVCTPSSFVLTFYVYSRNILVDLAV